MRVLPTVNVAGAATSVCQLYGGFSLQGPNYMNVNQTVALTVAVEANVDFRNLVGTVDVQAGRDH